MDIGNPMPETRTIPFNRSSLLGKELEYIFRAMTIGQIAGDQTFSRNCHSFLEQVLGVARALLTTSCTHALEMAALLLNAQPGDEVIVPSLAFVSTANAFALRGARIGFASFSVHNTAVVNIYSQLGARFAAAECVWLRCPSKFAAGEHQS
jgi:dTDP-4-amino-4,6-dideoxygalactose transaminase